MRGFFEVFAESIRSKRMFNMNSKRKRVIASVIIVILVLAMVVPMVAELVI